MHHESTQTHKSAYHSKTLIQSLVYPSFWNSLSVSWISELLCWMIITATVEKYGFCKKHLTYFQRVHVITQFSDAANHSLLTSSWISIKPLTVSGRMVYSINGHIPHSKHLLWDWSCCMSADGLSSQEAGLSYRQPSIWNHGPVVYLAYMNNLCFHNGVTLSMCAYDHCRSQNFGYGSQVIQYQVNLLSPWLGL